MYLDGPKMSLHTMSLDHQQPTQSSECVWDYPRPPIVVPSTSHVRVVHRGVVVAESSEVLRILETSQPPTYYIPRYDVRQDLLVPSRSASLCEWKGIATYWSLRIDGHVDLDVAWGYQHPMPDFRQITGYLAFYAQRVDSCWVDGEQVETNQGSFYGGWVTSNIEGPFKGAPGTDRW
jgi:uncharacterized protein (DUF427 family)